MGGTRERTPFKPGSRLTRQVYAKNSAEMSLTEKDKGAVKDLWKKISKSADAIGVEALTR